jgi:hypothetical protein
MKYICVKKIHVTKYEKLQIYFNTYKLIQCSLFIVCYSCTKIFFFNTVNLDRECSIK